METARQRQEADAPAPESVEQQAAQMPAGLGPEEPSFSALEAAPPAVRAAALMRMQAGAGNASVARALARQKLPGGGGGTAAPPSGPAANADEVSLDLAMLEWRTDLRRLAGERVRDAGRVFALATQNLGDEFAKKAAKDPPLILTMFDILVGLAAPGIADLLASAAVKGFLKDSALRAIMAANSGSKVKIGDMSHKGPLPLAGSIDLAVKADELIDKVVTGENLKSKFVAATEPVKGAFAPKWATNAFVQSKEEVMLEQLREDFRGSMDELSKSIGGMEAPDVIAVFLAYAPKNTSESMFRAMIRDFLAQRTEIEGAVSTQFDTKTTRIAEINAWGRPRMAIVAVEPTQLFAGKRGGYRFVKWVPEGMEGYAREQGGKDWNHGLLKLSPEDVRGHIDEPGAEESKVAEVETPTGSKYFAVVKKSGAKYELLNRVHAGDEDYARNRGARQPGGLLGLKSADLASQGEKYTEKDTKWW